MAKLSVLLVGGGSGGHIYPLLSVADAIKDEAVERSFKTDIRYFGSAGKYAELLKGRGVRVINVMSSKLKRYASLSNIATPFKFLIGFIQAMFKIYFFMPEVVFSKGGPGALPIVYASRWYRIPVIIHESDVVPGKTSLLSAKHAQIIELSWPSAKASFENKKIKGKINIVGSPLRKGIFSKISPAQARKDFLLKDEKPILLIVGGSQGAQAINYFILDHSQDLLRRYEIIHQVGEKNYEGFKSEFEFMSKHYEEKLKTRYHIHPSFSEEDMGKALSAADVVISRSGSSIFEIAAHSKPSILIPLPGSANNHQEENAYTYADSGAGVVIEQNNLLMNVFNTQVEKILKPAKKEKMAQAARNFYQPDASEKIAKDIFSLAGA